MNILGQCAKAGVLDFQKLTDRANVEVKAMRVRTASLNSDDQLRQPVFLAAAD